MVVGMPAEKLPCGGWSVWGLTPVIRRSLKGESKNFRFFHMTRGESPPGRKNSVGLFER